MFLHLSIILFTGGGLPQCMLGYHHPREAHPPGGTPPRKHPPPEAHNPLRSKPPSPGSTPPWEAPPPHREAHTPPGSTPPPRDGCCGGRYASYCNALLFLIMWLYHRLLFEDLPLETRVLRWTYVNSNCFTQRGFQCSLLCTINFLSPDQDKRMKMSGNRICVVMVSCGHAPTVSI